MSSDERPDQNLPASVLLAMLARRIGGVLRSAMLDAGGWLRRASAVLGGAIHRASDQIVARAGRARLCPAEGRPRPWRAAIVLAVLLPIVYVAYCIATIPFAASKPV